MDGSGSDGIIGQTIDIGFMIIRKSKEYFRLRVLNFLNTEFSQPNPPVEAACITKASVELPSNSSSCAALVTFIDLGFC